MLNPNIREISYSFLYCARGLFKILHFPISILPYIKSFNLKPILNLISLALEKWSNKCVVDAKWWVEKGKSCKTLLLCVKFREREKDGRWRSAAALINFSATTTAPSTLSAFPSSSQLRRQHYSHPLLLLLNQSTMVRPVPRAETFK